MVPLHVISPCFAVSLQCAILGYILWTSWTVCSLDTMHTWRRLARLRLTIQAAAASCWLGRLGRSIGLAALLAQGLHTPGHARHRQP